MQCPQLLNSREYTFYFTKQIFSSIINRQELTGHKFLKVTVSTACSFLSHLFRFLHFICVTDPPKENYQTFRVRRFHKVLNFSNHFLPEADKGKLARKFFNNIALIILHFQMKNKQVCLLFHNSYHWAMKATAVLYGRNTPMTSRARKHKSLPFLWITCHGLVL